MVKKLKVLLHELAPLIPPSYEAECRAHSSGFCG